MTQIQAIKKEIERLKDRAERHELLEKFGYKSEIQEPTKPALLMRLIGFSPSSNRWRKSQRSPSTLGKTCKASMS